MNEIRLEAVMYVPTPGTLVMIGSRHLNRGVFVDLRSRGFHPRRKAQMRAEFLQFFIQSETGRLRGDFKKHAAGFAEIDGMKIRPIDHWRHVVAKIDEMFAPLELFGFVLRPERNVMHRTRRDAAHPSVGQTKQVNNSARCSVVGRSKAKPISQFLG